MEYPTIWLRIKAAAIDVVILLVLMIFVTHVFSFFEQVTNITKSIAVLLIFTLYDPMLTSIFGGTIGHIIVGIRVKNEKDLNRNIIFPFAVARFLIKVTLGWISVMTIMLNEKGKAVHDIAVKSVVIFYNK